VPALNIKDPEVHALAKTLAERTGKSMTQVVKEALRERLDREPPTEQEQARVVARVLEIAHRIASRPVLDPRTPDEILGYDEYGLFGG
jgi:antitoxin VapB